MPRTKGVRNPDYESKRAELLDRMLPRFVRRDLERPSMRQLAAAANVTVPTLEHYFGRRIDVVTALLDEYRKRGEARLRMVASAEGDFESSMQAFAHGLVFGMQAGGAVRLGDVIAVSLAEGLADPRLGAPALNSIIDPAIDALRERLDHHVANGEMIATNTRAAALMMISPLLMAVLHQDQLGGCNTNPLPLQWLAKEVSASFVRSYKA